MKFAVTISRNDCDELRPDMYVGQHIFFLCVCANSLVITVYTQFVTSEILSIDECTRARSRTW